MDSLQDKLLLVMENESISQSMISRALGFSTATINQWLSFQYKGNTDKVDAAVEAFLRRQEEKSKLNIRNYSFCQTSVSQKIFEVARICHIDREIGLVYGDAGLGKTCAVKEYARQNPDVILIEATMGFSAKVLFSKIHKAIGLDGGGGLNQLFEDVVGKLKKSDRLIIVDEAEHLPYRALELLRRVYDMAEVGILLCGMERLRGNIEGKTREFAQMYSRVGIAGKVTSLDIEDSRMIVQNIIPDCSERLCKKFFECCRGNARLLNKLVLRSLRLSDINEEPLNEETIDRTMQLLVV
jgi:hypothetical protein